MYFFFEGSFPWFESKLNLTRLEYSSCTYFEQVFRYARSKTNLVISVLFIRSRLLTINSSILKLKMFSSLWGSWHVLECNQIVSLKNDMHHRRKGTVTISFTPSLCPSVESSKRFRRESVSKRLGCCTWN
jgi:hypothetical protein